MGNPFDKITRNSESTKKEWSSEKTDSTINSKQCDTCGAPRQKNTNLTTCSYCGSKFMTMKEAVKTDL